MLKEFNVDNDKEYKSFERLINFQTHDKNIYIFGKSGVGKTTFLTDFANKINNQKIQVSKFLIPKYKIMYFNVNEWIKDIQKAWGNQYENPIKINTYADILLIDDLGSEFFHSSTMPYILELFESRYEHVQKNRNNSITLITSNYSIDQLKEKYFKATNDQVAVDRLFSRLEGIMDLNIQFIGKDKRKKLNIER